MKVIAFVALALAASCGSAGAQTNIPGTLERPSSNEPTLTTPSSKIQLSPAQRTVILDAVRQEGKKVTAGGEFVATVGGSVPPQLELYVLPDRALASVPAVKTVKYTQVHDQIVLVDPTTMRIVDIIPQ